MPRPIVSVTRSLTAPYSAIEAWVYDRFVGPAGVRAMAPVLEPLLQGLPGDAVLLDVGCGGGHLVAYLATRGARFHLQGVDLNGEQVRRARRRTSEFGDRVRIEEGSALDLPYADGTCDVVLSVTSVKHWPDQIGGLREMLRVLRHGGQLYVVEIDRGCQLADARQFIAMLPLPSALQSAMLPFFRTYILGQGWDSDDARALAEALPLRDSRVQRIPGVPVVALSGIK